MKNRTSFFLSFFLLPFSAIKRKQDVLLTETWNSIRQSSDATFTLSWLWWHIHNSVSFLPLYMKLLLSTFQFTATANWSTFSCFSERHSSLSHHKRTKLFRLVLTVGSIRIHQHKICTIRKVTTTASNITAKQAECLITHRHQQTDWNYSCVCAVYTQRYITVTVLRTLLYSSWSVLRVKWRAVSVMITFASAFLEK